jgi:hypothetical protein
MSIITPPSDSQTLPAQPPLPPRPQTLPPPLPPQASAPPATSFAEIAAQISWITPIAGVAMNFAMAAASASTNAKGFIALFSLALFFLGLIFGIIALFQVRRHGTKGVLIPAIVGVSLNAILLLFVTIVVILVTVMTVNHLSQQQGAPQPLPPSQIFHRPSPSPFPSRRLR